MDPQGRRMGCHSVFLRGSGPPKGGVQTDGAVAEGGHGECTALFGVLNIFYFC